MALFGHGGETAATIAEQDTATQGLARVGNIFQDRRQPGHQEAGASQPNPHRHSTTVQSIPEGEPLDDSPLPINPVRGIVITERDKQLLADLRKAPRCIISRYATTWAELSGRYQWSPVLDRLWGLTGTQN